MNEQTKIAKVWHIDNNELKCCNKKIITTTYNGIEIAILKQERNWSTQEFLLKDKNNEYWQLGIAPIKFNLFVNPVITNQEEKNRIEQYRNDITEVYKNIDFKKFWQKKIDRNDFFNKCELAYIEKYYPEMLEKARESRKIYEQNRNKRYEEERINRERREKEEVKQANDTFKKELKEMKYKIFIGEMVYVKDFTFFKDDKYENGKTFQNNILYLAKHYGIKIPLATQGFINNRLQKYNFKQKIGTYLQVGKNKKCSEKMGEYLDQILEKVQDEYKEKLKSKSSPKIKAR